MSQIATFIFLLTVLALFSRAITTGTFRWIGYALSALIAASLTSDLQSLKLFENPATPLDTFLSLLSSLSLIMLSYVIVSCRIVKQGDEAIVQRLGRFVRVLKPGLNFVIPWLDKTVTASMKEQILSLPRETAMTQDNTPIVVDVLVYWQILDVVKAYYAVEDLELSLAEIAASVIRSEIGSLMTEEALYKVSQINQALLRQLDRATITWGIKVIRTEFRKITLPEKLLETFEAERIARNKKTLEMVETEATVRTFEELRRIMPEVNSETILRYLLVRQYLSIIADKGSDSLNPDVINLIGNSLFDESITELIDPERR